MNYNRILDLVVVDRINEEGYINAAKYFILSGVKKQELPELGFEENDTLQAYDELLGENINFSIGDKVRIKDELEEEYKK